MRSWIAVASAAAAMVLGSAAAAQGAGPQVTDARPKDERDAKVLSNFMLSCNYGIVRIGDAGREPDRIERLRRDLAAAEGLGLDGKTVTVKRYSVHSVETVLLDLRIGTRCGRDNTKAGWYSPEEAGTITAQPIVIEAALSVDGVTYEARSVTAFKHGNRFEDFSTPMAAEEINAAMAAMNQTLIAKIRAARR
ncbi:MAG: hypothetical protein JSR45_18495 [Proteobacteria bacterium]|nr:hypothetical protein [Pseudomonadota bacterium]